MKKDTLFDANTEGADDQEMPDLELSDEDILDAMAKIPGYLDITTTDFRAIYHLAHDHALKRLFRGIRAGSLMRTGVAPLRPDTRLDEAAGSLAGQGLKSLPVVDAEDIVIGILTESDFLRRLNARTFLELLLRLLADDGVFSHRCHQSSVSEAMTASPVTVSEDAGFLETVRAFRAHEGRSMPVVDGAGRLRGLLLRKDFVRASHLEELF